MRIGWTGLVLGLLTISPTFADDVPAAPTWERHILPLLKTRCVKCHGPARREGKLNLATAKGLVRGGKHGPVVTPGQPDESRLWERVEDDEMPPDEPLSDDEKTLLRRWIERGSGNLPRVSPGEPEGADHWAFAPATRPKPPEARAAGSVRNDVDRFVLAALEARNLSLSPETDRPTLIRRVAFDLTGLPPSPEEIARFQTDESPDA
jgi:hypothetical protein